MEAIDAIKIMRSGGGEGIEYVCDIKSVEQGDMYFIIDTALYKYEGNTINYDYNRDADMLLTFNDGEKYPAIHITYRLAPMVTKFPYYGSDDNTKCTPYRIYTICKNAKMENSITQMLKFDYFYAQRYYYKGSVTTLNRNEFLGRLINFYTIAASTFEPFGLCIPFKYKSDICLTTLKISCKDEQGANVRGNKTTAPKIRVYHIDSGDIVYEGSANVGNYITRTVIKPGTYRAEITDNGTLYKPYDDVYVVDADVEAATFDSADDPFFGEYPQKTVDVYLKFQKL